ncbi:MAG: hypothetical protein ACRDFX_12670 [Chloroflexota bacterium]
MIRRIRACLVGLFLLLLAGCGGNSATGKAIVHHHATMTPTLVAFAPTAVIDTPTPVAPASTPKPKASPTATPRASATAKPVTPHRPRLLSASLSPYSVAPGAGLTASVSSGGNVSAVTMYLASGPGGGNPISFNLSQNASGAWSGIATAPTTPGIYHYTVGLFDAAGRRSTFDNDGWNVRVTGSSPPPATRPPVSAPQTLPANIPLSPPFSYGNPLPAVFTADGRTIHGSEVVSNTRTDVAASNVSGWYVIHFPRAGWTLQPATIPAGGARTFTMVANSGAQVCVVQFSAGTVQVFYGSTATG